MKRALTRPSSTVNPGNADPTTAYVFRPACRVQVFNDRFIDSSLSTVDSRTSAEHGIAPGAACPAQLLATGEDGLVAVIPPGRALADRTWPTCVGARRAYASPRRLAEPQSLSTVAA